ncbi:MAG: AsmA family protein, partial [Pseudomonadota bacterium]
MDSKLVQDEPRGDAPAEKPRRRRSRRRRAGLWTMRGTVVLVVLALVAGFMVIGHRLHAPVWLRDRLETRLEQNMGGLQLGVGDVSLIIHEGWRPRLRLTDVTISDAAGQQIAQVSDMRSSLAMRPLLRGQIRPKRIILNGAQIALARGEDGALTLTVGAGSAPVQQAPNLAELIETGDAVFLAPILSALTSVQVDAITLDYRDLR